VLSATSLDRWLQELAHQPPLEIDVAPPAGEVLAIFPPWLQTAIRIFFALLPILLILGLLLLARSRARRRVGLDEERESLWSWAASGSDRACAIASAALNAASVLAVTFWMILSLSSFALPHVVSATSAKTLALP